MAVVEAAAAAAGAEDVAGGPGGEEPEVGSTAGCGAPVARFGALRVLKGLSKADLSQFFLFVFLSGKGIVVLETSRSFTTTGTLRKP